MAEAYQTDFDQKHGLRAITETLGGPDVTQLFVHDTMSIRNADVLASFLPGYRRYCERALVVARAHDIVCVLHEVDNHYVRFLSSFGLGPREGNVIVASESKHSKPVPSARFSRPSLGTLAAAAPRYRSS